MTVPAADGSARPRPAVRILKVVAVLAGIAAFVAYALKEQSARTAGAPAVVTSANPEHQESGDRVQYTFTVNGAEQRGESRNVTWYERGMAVQACHDPASPGNSELAPASHDCASGAYVR